MARLGFRSSSQHVSDAGLEEDANAKINQSGTRSDEAEANMGLLTRDTLDSDGAVKPSANS